MTWANRLKLLLGFVVAVAIVGACTLVFTQRQSSARSSSASITAEVFSVGASYAGTVVAQDVEVGDAVSAGDVMFTVRSPQLVRDLESEVITASDLDGVDAKAGTYDVVATVDGTVASVTAPVGDFVGGGTEVATVEQDGSMEVAARFTLTPRDYGRIAQGSRVDLQLPNDTTLSGVVDAVEVETVDGQAASTITVVSTALAHEKIGGLYRPGTPVVATLHLRDDGPLAGLGDAMRDFLRRLGL